MRQVLLEIGGELVFRGLNRRRNFGRLHQRVLDGDLFIAAAKLFLNFGGGDGDSVGNQVVEFFGDHAFAEGLFKFRDGHACARLYLADVLVLQPDAIRERQGQNLLDAVTFLVGRDLHRKALGLILHGALEDHLVEDFAGVEAAHHLGNGLAPAHLIELLLHVDDTDGLPADDGRGVRTAGVAGRTAEESRDQSDDHADADEDQNDRHGNLDPAITVQIALLNAL